MFFLPDLPVVVRPFFFDADFDLLVCAAVEAVVVAPARIPTSGVATLPSTIARQTARTAIYLFIAIICDNSVCRCDEIQKNSHTVCVQKLESICTS